ncbi:translation protein SH3-like domain-containing protein [Truncatella angustata]|uniref:Translation protein SH3-like domain-containing protein n=1 Tax=Truncatella angustata TaxID=152316 RepID=A0A9P8UZJ6_9PEZI|nr:translation protein SH3-like domain-containing protein [Truncatella angustata]KAH6661087.1 translation protein SH3-like domain-containing protein [Truncatella angustata]
MNCSAAVRRPLGPVKTLLRQSRQQRVLFRRSMATETVTPTTDAAAAGSIPPPGLATRTPQRFHVIPSNNPAKPIRTAFAVYAPPPSARAAHPSPLVSYHAQQIRRLDRTGARTQLFSKKNPDAAKVGDVLQVSSSRGEPFAGVCLSIRRAGVDTAILLRNTLFKTGTEMWYKIYSPTVQGIEIIWRRPKRARRARLTFMRQPRHDMGNVEHLVDAWRKARNVFSSKSQKGGQKGGRGGGGGGRPSQGRGKR